MQTKVFSIGLSVLGAAALIGGTSVYAANKIGTVTGKDGDVKDKVSMTAEVTQAAGSHVTIQDTETGKTYETSFGPQWYSGTYNVGDKVTVEGVETTGENQNGHNFQTMKVNDTTLRENFESKPAWAGQRGQGKGMHNGSNGQNHGSNFVDANGDGVCDHMQ